MIIYQRQRREARLGEETAPVSRFNVIIIQSRSRGGTDFCRCTERRNSRNSSARSTRDFRCRRSGEGGGRRKGLLSLIYLEGSFATCSRYNFAIYSGQWRAATINISILLCPVGKCALLMGNTYPSRRRVSRDGVHLYT